MNAADEGMRSDSVLKDWARACGDGVAFLRHEREGVSRREGSDWDVAVFDAAWAAAVSNELFGRPLLEIKRTYVEQRRYCWGQLDFLPLFQWNGFCYLDSKRFWSSVQKGEDGLSRPCLAHDAFIAWMTSLLGGGFHNTRYEEFVQRAWSEDREELFACFQWAFGEELAKKVSIWLERGKPELIGSQVGRFRRALKLQSFQRSYSNSCSQILRHWGRELRFHWHPPFPWIAFLGPDGSGKTTATNGVVEWLKAKKIDSFYVHWYPPIMPPLSRPSGDVVSDPHNQSSRGVLGSTLQTVYIGLMWILARVGVAWHARAKSSAMISDRYYHDLLVDPKRYRNQGMRWLNRLIFKMLPQPDQIFILLAPSSVILARKEEVSPMELERQIGEYQKLVDWLGEGAQIIDASKPISVIQESLTKSIEDLLRSR